MPGGWEIAIIVVIVLLIFGGKLIPRLGSFLGRSITGLKKGIQEGGEGFKSALKEETKTDATAEDGKDQNKPEV